MKKYLITVRTIKGSILTFKVYTYIIADGYVSFNDEKNNMVKHFPVQDCNIEEVQ